MFISALGGASSFKKSIILPYHFTNSRAMNGSTLSHANRRLTKENSQLESRTKRRKGGVRGRRGNEGGGEGEVKRQRRKAVMR